MVVLPCISWGPTLEIGPQILLLPPAVLTAASPDGCAADQPVKEKVSFGVTTPPMAALVRLAGVW
jgi:hypothetical protein